MVAYDPQQVLAAQGQHEVLHGLEGAAHGEIVVGLTGGDHLVGGVVDVVAGAYPVEADIGALLQQAGVAIFQTRAERTTSVESLTRASVAIDLTGDVALLWPREGFLPGLVSFLLAFRLALSRRPTTVESDAMQRYLAEEAARFRAESARDAAGVAEAASRHARVQLCRVVLNLNEFVYPD